MKEEMLRQMKRNTREVSGAALTAVNLFILHTQWIILPYMSGGRKCRWMTLTL